MSQKDDLICIAECAKPHGVKGQVMLRVFAEDLDLLFHSNGLIGDNGQTYHVRDAKPHKHAFLSWLDGIDSREKAEEVQGVKLHVRRADLPEVSGDEVYHVDLMGLTAVDKNGATVGTIKTVQNFGASDLLEIERFGKKTLLLPYTAETIGDIDLEAGTIGVDIPDGIAELYE